MTKAPTLLEYLEKIGEIEWLQEVESPVPIEWLRRYQIIVAAAIAFFSQPLALWMFIPCGKDGKPMEKPEQHPFENEDGIGSSTEAEIQEYWSYVNEYQSALDRVVFEGWELTERDDSESYYALTNDEWWVLFYSDRIEVHWGDYEIIQDPTVYQATNDPDFPAQFTQSVKENLNLK